ncbi:MAG: phosphotransferase [Heyndrickxia sp.]
MSLGNLLGRGNTAEVYELKDNKNEVLKLFYEKIPYEIIAREYETSKAICQLGIPSPNVQKLLEIENKWGITYEKLNGKNFTQILSAQPFLLRKHARRFAELQASFHTKTNDKLPSQKAYLSRNIQGTNLLLEEEKQKIVKYLEQLPEDNKVCHGDFHTDNIIVMDGEAKILDWMTGTSGNPCGDVARTLLIMRDSYLPSSMPKITRILLETVRKMFAKQYINHYMKISKTPFENIEKWLLPIMAARLVEGVPAQEKESLVLKIRSMI